MLNWREYKPKFIVLSIWLGWIIIISIISMIITCFVEKKDLYDLFILSEESMQNIWVLHLTIIGVVSSIFLFFLDSVKDRRLGMSYKYIFYHNDVFGYANVMVVMVNNIILLIFNFGIAYILTGIVCSQVQAFIRAFFLLNLIFSVLHIGWLMVLFLIARYKESIIYVKIRKKVYCKLKKRNEIKLKEEYFSKYVKEELDRKFKKIKYNKQKIKMYEDSSNIIPDVARKIKRNSKVDCELVKKSEGYDSYFGASILTLFALFFANPEKNKELLECIATRIIQRNESGFSEKWELHDKDYLINKLQESCVEEVTVKEDIAVLICIKEKWEDYYDILQDYLNCIEVENFLYR